MRHVLIKNLPPGPFTIRGLNLHGHLLRCSDCSATVTYGGSATPITIAPGTEVYPGHVNTPCQAPAPRDPAPTWTPAGCLVMGFPADTILRWGGMMGWGYDDAVRMCAAFNIPGATESRVAPYIDAGARGDGTIAQLDADDASDLEEFVQ